MYKLSEQQTMELTKQLENELLSFPSYLCSFEDLRKCSKKRLKQVFDRISSETYDNEVERIRDLNLAAFLQHELGEKENALRDINQALSRNDKNINALVLKGWFFQKSEDVHECKEILGRLRPLLNDRIEMLHAKAEVAYIYTRLGIRFYDKAIEKFESVFSEIDKDKVPVGSVASIVWKFGLALTIKRTLNFNNLYDQNKFDLTVGKMEAAFKVYNDIYESQTDSKYKARSLVEMGELVSRTTSRDGAKGLKANSILLKKPTEEYFQEALQLCDTDPFVLQRCGKHYRYRKDFDISIELLRKSIEGKQNEYNSYGHHHLALSLKKKLENSLQQTYSKRGGSYRRPSNSWRGRRPRGFGGASSQRKIQSDTKTEWGYPTVVAYSGQYQIGTGIKSFSETLSSVAQSSSLTLTQGESGSGDVRLSETDPSLEINKEFESKLNLSTGAPRCYYGKRFSRQRTRARANLRTEGNYRKFVNFTDMDYDSGYSSLQSKPSCPQQRCEPMNKQIKLKEFLVKSPWSVISLEHAEKGKVTEILEHLDKAFKINENIAALYDRGLTLRALGLYDDAIKVFKLFFEKDRSPLVYLANAYEQSAFCMISKLEKLHDSEERERERITCNFQHCLSVCIEISYRTIMQKYPDFNYCRVSEAVLEDFLNKKERTKESRKELCDFYRKVEKFTEAIYFAEDLLKLEGNKEEQHIIRMDMIRDYCKLEQYDNAILTINLIGDEMDDIPLLHKAHLEGGLQSYIKEELELAKTRLKTALSCGKVQDISNDEENEAEFFDIFILCSENSEDSPRHVKHSLEKLGLQVTVNFDDLLPNEMKSSGIVKVMENSSHFICFLEQSNTSVDDAHMFFWLESMRNIFLKRSSGQMLFIKRDQNTDIPSSYTHFPWIEYKDEMETISQGTKIDETQLEWIKILLQKLTKISD